MKRPTLLQLQVLAHGMSHPRFCGRDIMTLTGSKPGSVYPCLYTMEANGLLGSEWEEGDPHELSRPLKHLYWVTEKGGVLLSQFRAALSPLN